MTHSTEMTTFGLLHKSITKLLQNPVAIASITLVYTFISAGTFLYYRQEKFLEKQRQEIEFQRQQTSMARDEIAVVVNRLSSRQTIDIFRPLSFRENSSPDERDKLQAALRLNSLVHYALLNRDFQKAADTIDESMHTYPTLEARYYRGLLAYARGDTDTAAAFWEPLAKSDAAPSDLYLYISIAKYKSGDTETAKRYAELYQKSK